MLDFVVTGKFSTYEFMTNLSLNSNARGARTAALAAARAGRNETRTRNTYAADVEIRAANGRAAAFEALRSKLNIVTKTLDKATERLVEVKEILLDMQKRITLAQKTGVTATERTAYAQQFDQLLGDVNLRVKTAGYSGTNLIGTSFRDSFTPDNLEYRSRPNSLSTVIVSGEYLGSDYYVEDANGDQHYPTIRLHAGDRPQSRSQRSGHASPKRRSDHPRLEHRCDFHYRQRGRRAAPIGYARAQRTRRCAFLAVRRLPNDR